METYPRIPLMASLSNNIVGAVGIVSRSKNLEKGEIFGCY